MFVITASINAITIYGNIFEKSSEYLKVGTCMGQDQCLIWKHVPLTSLKYDTY